MRELSVVEQRYQAVLAVIAEGDTVKDVAARWRVSRQTLHGWLARYEAGGLDGLAVRSRRPVSCPHQMVPAVEAVVLEMRRAHSSWGPRRIRAELIRRPKLLAAAGDGLAVPSESGVYRSLVRAGVIDPADRRKRRGDWKRWERARPNELWQMDIVGGLLIADGTSAKVLTGIDDHSRFCVSAKVMARERTQPVCDGLAAAMRAHGVPEQILTDNGKVFTGRFHAPPVEVLFDRICRENGIEHLLTKPRSPTTTGKIERFHRTMRSDFDTTQVFTSLRTAQGALDEWVREYNHDRPHQAIGDRTPAERFAGTVARPVAGTAADLAAVTRSKRPPTPPGTQWVSRKIASNGIVCVDWQRVSVGQHFGGQACDVLVTETLLQFWVGEKLLKTVTRDRSGSVRKLRADAAHPRR